MLACICTTDRAQPTNDIVPIAVLDQCRKHVLATFVSLRNGEHDVPTLLISAKLQTFLDHIAGEFVLGERQELSSYGRDDFRTIFRETTLKHVLGDVIAVLIGNEFGSFRVKLGQYEPTFGFGALLQQPLDHAAPEAVRRQRTDLATESFNYVANVVNGNSFNDFLDHVVAVVVSDASQNISL